MANNNFVVKNGLTVNGSFTANSTAVNASAITATSVNAATLSISGDSVATLITSNATTAYTNAISYADTKSSAAYTNAVSLVGNATNITSGTLPNARLSSAVVNTSGSFTIGGPINFSNGVTFSNTITASGSNGTAGQVLTSSGPSGNVFWSSAALGVNTAAALSWTNAHIFSNTLTVNNSTLSVGNTTTNTSITLGTITLSNGAVVSTVNATVYSGTANNAAALSGVSLTTIQGQITGNAATAYSNAVSNAAAIYKTASDLATSSGTAYSNAIAYSAVATNLSSGTVPTARLASGTANTTTFLRGDQTWSIAGTVTSVGSGTGLTGGPVTGSGTISLATAGAGAATYSSGVSAITVDAYGRVTSVTGSAGYVTSSGVTSVATGTGLTGGPITSTGTVSLATAGAGASSYSSGISAITVDAYGRVTSVSGSANYTALNGSPTFNAITGTGQIKGLSLVSTGGAVYLANDLQTYMAWDNTNIVFNKKTLCTSDVGTNGKFFGSGGGAAVLAAGSTNVLYFSWNGSDLIYDINNGAVSRAIYYFGASDQRLKTNISNTEVDSLSIINSIGLKKFDWTDEGLNYNLLQEKDKSVKIGVIAQELSQVIPEAVIKIKNKEEVETQLLKGEAIIPYLIGAIQEQQKQIADLQTQINLLKK
jgi:hypothetical protein